MQIGMSNVRAGKANLLYIQHKTIWNQYNSFKLKSKYIEVYQEMFLNSEPSCINKPLIFFLIFFCVCALLDKRIIQRW